MADHAAASSGDVHFAELVNQYAAPVVLTVAFVVIVVLRVLKALGVFGGFASDNIIPPPLGVDEKRMQENIKFRDDTLIRHLTPTSPTAPELPLPKESSSPRKASSKKRV